MILAIASQSHLRCPDSNRDSQMTPTRIVTQPTGMTLTLGVALPRKEEEVPLKVLLAQDKPPPVKAG
jgi:hypothetical protein